MASEQPEKNQTYCPMFRITTLQTPARALDVLVPGLRRFSTTPRVWALASATENIVAWRVYAQFHRHNTMCLMVALVDPSTTANKNESLSYNEQVIAQMNLRHHVKYHVSAGMLGFRKGNRAEYEAAYQVCSKFFRTIEEKQYLQPNDKVETIFKGNGKGRDAFVSMLNGKEGSYLRPHVVRVTDATPLKFGGARSKKLRRL